MTDQQQPEHQAPENQAPEPQSQTNREENLRQEFETLGRNLVEAMRTAWEAPESKRLRDDLVNGLAELGGTLKREAENLSNSDAAQQVRNGVEQVGEKLRAPEVQAKVRSELVSTLQTVNNELQKVINRMANTGASTGAAAGDVAMGGAGIANETVPDITDEDPFAQNVQPGSGEPPAPEA